MSKPDLVFRPEDRLQIVQSKPEPFKWRKPQFRWRKPEIRMPRLDVRWLFEKFVLFLCYMIAGLIALVVGYLMFAGTMMGMSFTTATRAMSAIWSMFPTRSLVLFFAPILGTSSITSILAVVFGVKLFVVAFTGYMIIGFFVMIVVSPYFAYRWMTNTHVFEFHELPQYVRWEVRPNQHNIPQVFITNLHESRPLRPMGISLVCDYHRGPLGISKPITTRNENLIGPGRTGQLFWTGTFGYPGWEHRLNVNSCRVVTWQRR